MSAPKLFVEAANTTKAVDFALYIQNLDLGAVIAYKSVFAAIANTIAARNRYVVRFTRRGAVTIVWIGNQKTNYR